MYRCIYCGQDLGTGDMDNICAGCRRKDDVRSNRPNAAGVSDGDEPWIACNQTEPEYWHAQFLQARRRLRRTRRALLEAIRLARELMSLLGMAE